MTPMYMASQPKYAVQGSISLPGQPVQLQRPYTPTAADMERLRVYSEAKRKQSLNQPLSPIDQSALATELRTGRTGAVTPPMQAPQAPQAPQSPMEAAMQPETMGPGALSSFEERVQAPQGVLSQMQQRPPSNQNAIYDGALQAGVGLLSNTADPSKALAAGFQGFGQGYDQREAADKAQNVPKVVPLAGGRGALLVYPDGRMEEKTFPEMNKLMNNPFGKAPTGFRFDANGNLEAIPGGPADAKAQAAAKADRFKADGIITSVDNVMGTVDQMLSDIESSKVPLLGDTTTGMTGAALGLVPGTAAYNLRETATTIKANLGFDRLQQMREASTTGGALGQVAVQELQALQATIASINPNQSPEKVKENLQKVRDQYKSWKAAFQASRSEVGGASKDASSPPPAASGSSGVPEQFRSFVPQ